MNEFSVESHIDPNFGLTEKNGTNVVLLFSEIMNDVVRATVKEHNKQPGRMEWRVLVVDDQSMRMVSACTKMHELSAEGITSKTKTCLFFPSNDRLVSV